MQDATAQSSTQNVPLPEFADIVTPSPFGTTPVYKPRTVTPFEIDDFSYAVITGVQIINITDPELPSPVANIVHGEEYNMLNGSRAITTVTLGPFTYALVTAFVSNGVQIINITDPASPSPVTSITYDNTDYPKLNGAYGIATTTINSSLYALVLSYYSGLQIIGLDHGFISAYTSNQNPKYAKAGDTLIINFNASGTIASHTSQILGLNANANATVNGAVYNATVTVPSTPREAYATFMINVTNTQGTNATITESDISLSNVFIDTISPTIKLNGANNTIVYLGDSYTDLNATASDSTYEYDITVKGIGSVNTSQTGVYTLNYTAPDDMAGNPGSTIYRTVHVVDVPPFELVQYLAKSPTGDPANTLPFLFEFFAHPETVNPFKIGNSTYAGIHTYYLQRGGDTLPSYLIINITDPNEVSFIPIDSSTFDEFYFYYRYPSFLTDAAYTVIDGSTYAIAISERDDRVLIINVSNPSNPDLVTNVSDTANYALGKPSDIATITLDSSTYALVTSYDDNGVQIINITDPRNPIPASAIFDDVDNYTELAGAKSIATITIGLSSFALVAASNDDGVQIINITDPYNPTPTSAITDGVGGYEELDGARSITTTTIGTSTYALVAAAYDDGVQIIDITDPRNPIPVFVATKIMGMGNV